MKEAVALVHDPQRLESMEKNAAALALPDAARVIVDCAYELVK